jgi:hypothetical protein
MLGETVLLDQNLKMKGVHKEVLESSSIWREEWAKETISMQEEASGAA